MKQPESCNTDIKNEGGKSRYISSKISIESLDYTPKSTSAIIEAGDSFRDKVGNIDSKGKRLWIYPQKPKGELHTKRMIFAYFLIAVLFITPFIKIGGEALFMFNIVERKFVIFGNVFLAQDFYLFALGFLVLFLSVILFTSIFGRVWCGWACPQTIFMEMVFRKLEYWIEGNSNQQRALNNQPLNFTKFRIKATKFTIFYILSFLVGNLLLSYIIGIDELVKIINAPVTEHLSGFITMIIFSLIFFFVFAWFREQACTFVCPYGRLQSVLLDKNTVVVAYDNKRGENREKFKKVGRSEDAGDCIDCRKCAFVCPTGIDIRNGTQLECVNCTACIDACDDVMMKINKPKGLIRFASLNQIETGEKFKFTPRLMAYSTLLLGILAVLIILLTIRNPIDVKILRAKGSLYTLSQDGRISNLYTFKMINKSNETMNIELAAPDIDAKFTLVGIQKIVIPSNKQIEAALIVNLPLEKTPKSSNEFEILIKNNGEVLDKVEIGFSAPLPNERKK